MLYLRFIHLIFNGTSIAFIDSDIYNTLLSGWATWGIFFGSIFLWFIILWLWEKVNFKGSLEWVFGKLTSKGTKVKSSKSDLKFALRNVVSVIDEKDGVRYYNGWEFFGIFFLVLVNIIATAALLLL